MLTPYKSKFTESEEKQYSVKFKKGYQDQVTSIGDAVKMCKYKGVACSLYSTEDDSKLVGTISKNGEVKMV